MARPKKDQAERRTERNEQRYTPAEDEQIRQSAASAGLSSSEFIRRAALQMPVAAKPSSVDPAFVVALNRIGNNVNQLAHAAHCGQAFQYYWEDVGADLRDILNQALDRMDG